MINLTEITEDNWLDVAALSVKENQKKYLASPIDILARGYVYRNCNGRVYVIKEGKTVIGVALVREFTDEPLGYDLQQFMIDQRFQGKGYGSDALGLILEELRKEGHYDHVEVCVKKEDAEAIHLYEKHGFTDSGYIDEEMPDAINMICYLKKKAFDFPEEAKQFYTQTREEIVNGFYNRVNEDVRLQRSRHGQLEYLTTMAYIHRYVDTCSKVLEIGAGTGRYSIALAKEGMDVTAVELTENNLAILKENSKGIANIHAYLGDATDLGRFSDNFFDVTLAFGPMYHLYEHEEIQRAIDEAIRVTKPGGVLLFAFLSVYAIMYANYFTGNWAFGQEENFTEDYRTKHFKEQLFTGYDITEFEQLFAEKPVVWITTAGVDGPLESLEYDPEFCIEDEDFDQFAKWYLAFAEKRELLGSANHLLYICRKK